jgi:radical SAM-linked protein
VRVRLRFTKLGKVRFTGHRDVARILERALRRAALPLAMTEGFSPRPKVHFGLALSTGYESLGEYMDFDLRPDDADEVQIGALPGQLTALLPLGLTVENAAVIDRSETSLQQAVTSCSWRLDIVGVDPDDVARRIERLLARDTIPVTRERKGQKVHDDLRPTVLGLALVGEHIETELSTQPRGVRPSELLAAFDPPLPDPITEGGRVCRTHQWITTQSISTDSISTGDGAKREPLSATSSPHAEERAS